MPTPHFDKIIISLLETWFFGTRRLAGENYGKILKKKFDSRGDKTAIDSALSLGNYAIHTESNKRKRIVLRAVLLAHTLMRGSATSEIDNLKSSYKSLDLEALKRAFVNQFPLLESDTNRMWWEPKFFTLPILLPDLRIKQSWIDKLVPAYMFLVHTNATPETPSAVYQNPIGELQKYAASSFSVMSNLKPQTYFDQGLIFTAPSNNILVTFYADVFSVLREQSMHQETFMKQSFAEEITELLMATGGGELLRPSTVINKQYTGLDNLGTNSKYNEILVCGQPGVPLPQGQTGALRVRGVFISITKDGNIAGPMPTREARETACIGHAKRLGVPLLYLPNTH